MKKLLKIISISMLILFVFCITTSLALANPNPSVNMNASRKWVNENTTASEMVNALNSGYTLTGITGTIKDQNPYLYCRERHWALYYDGVYEKEKEYEQYYNTGIYPGTDANGYAKAYILAAPGYVKNDQIYEDADKYDERQFAWYFILGQTDGDTPPDLYNIAIDYQNYKKNEQDMNVTVGTDANTMINGANLVYGPIKVQYTYQSATSGNKSDEWGGFQYAFFDKNGSNVNSKVNLCTLSNGTYTPVSSGIVTEEGESKGYYQIKTTSYNNKDLYVVTQDKSLGAVSLKIRENKVDYTAKVTSIRGERYGEAHYTRCYTCTEKCNHATENMQDVIADPNKLWKKDGKYYKLVETKEETSYSLYSSSVKNAYVINGKRTNAETLADVTSGVTYCSYCSQEHSAYNIKHYTGNHSCDSHSKVYMCNACHEESCFGYTGSFGHRNNSCTYSNYTNFTNHFKSEHITSNAYKYTKKVYYFEEFTGCGADRGDKVSDCGTWLDAGYYHSQGLDIIESTEERKSNEIKLDINIKFATSVEVQKVWDDRNNVNKIQPDSITVKLLADGVDTGKTVTLNNANGWKASFPNLDPTNANGKEIKYTVKEIGPAIYVVQVNETQNNVYTITNKLRLIDIPVTKVWTDNNNSLSKRPSSVTIKLYADGKDTGKKLTLNDANQWKGTFTNLLEYNESKNLIKYTIKEANVGYHYDVNIQGNSTSGFTVTNKIRTIDIPVTKVWNDNNNSSGKRPSSIIIKLYADGKDTGKQLTLNDANQWKGTFTGLLEYNDSGNKVKYTLEEVKINDYDSIIKGNQTSGFTVTNTYYFGYIEISGKVWKDEYDGKSNTLNGVLDSKEKGIEGIKVILRDKDGKQFDATSTAITDSNGNYTIKVNYDNSYGVFKLYANAETVKEKIKTAYIEFEYNAMKYTTVAPSATGTNTSKAIENETTRNAIDSNYATITSSMQSNIGENEKITASTKGVINTIENYEYKTQEKKTVPIKNCTGNGNDICTNNVLPWNNPQTGTHSNCNNCANPLKTFDVDVGLIKNVNLGLFEREQPKVALTSDLTKGEVTMKGQKYTYKYGVKSEETKYADLQAQFETKYTYEYKRPVNPSDIAYIQKPANKNEMGVVVTYKIKVANLSKTIPITVNYIANYFDSRYTLNNAADWKITNHTEFNKAINSKDLNITLQPQTSDTVLELSYTLSIDAILDLFNKEATLNHASEIEAYSSIYGGKTIYAEQRTNGRTGKPYAGYNKDSYPGNAGIHINSDGRLDATNFEADTDIAPSFILHKAESPKTISGTIFEDTDVKTDDAERLGDGKYDASKEKTIQNVRVELYNLDGKIAQVYKDINSKETVDGIVYSDENGNYAITGVVTGEYFVRFVYGDDTTELTNGPTKIGGTTRVNARDYKSTIITNNLLKGLLNKNYADYTNNEKQWITTIEDNSSVAVDNMLDRLDIDDLYYKNFHKNEDGTVYIEPENMTAYTKPFITGVEYDEDKEGQSDKFGNIEEILLDDITNLDKLDFGIIERPREDMFIQKTITHFNLTLANGQELISGNPTTDTLNYAKTMGFKQEITSGEAARKALPKRLLVEMDVELIQGSSMELEYEVKVTNNNELDYDYGNISDYGDIKAVITEGVNDEYITKSGLAKYYYYGDKTGLNEMQTTIELADYLNEKVIYEVDATKWTPLDAKTDLYEKELIGSKKYDEIKDSQYKIFRNASGTSMTLTRGSSWTEEMTVSKKLANLDENVYDNGLEILKIDGKTARTIQAIDENGDGEKEIVEKTYKPGNYEPGSSNGEQDDDIVEVIITPPTGIVEYIVTYLIAGLVGLIVIAVVVIFIKKNMTKR